MAQYYKVDNRFLNEEEYNEHCVGLWAVCLFFATAIYCGYQLHGVIPHEWAKEMRFAALVVPSVITGAIAARLAGFRLLENP
jgi:tetrahydromethanopterin S-methyltransferase subunit D